MRYTVRYGVIFRQELLVLYSGKRAASGATTVIEAASGTEQQNVGIAELGSSVWQEQMDLRVLCGWYTIACNQRWPFYGLRTSCVDSLDRRAVWTVDRSRWLWISGCVDRRRCVIFPHGEVTGSGPDRAHFLRVSGAAGHVSPADWRRPLMAGPPTADAVWAERPAAAV